MVNAALWADTWLFLHEQKGETAQKRQTNSTHCDVSKVKHLITPQGIGEQNCRLVLRESQNIWNSQNLATDSEQTSEKSIKADALFSLRLGNRYILKKKKKVLSSKVNACSLGPCQSTWAWGQEVGWKREWDGVHMVRNISGISSSSGKDVMLLWHYSALRRWIRCTQRRSHNALPGFWGHKSAAVLRTQSGFRLYARIYDWLITTPNSQIWML